MICPDHCGFSNVVTDGCGIKLPLRPLSQFEQDLAAAISGLAVDEKRRRILARGAIERSKDFSWEEKAASVDAIYRRVLANKAK